MGHVATKHSDFPSTLPYFFSPSTYLSWYEFNVIQVFIGFLEYFYCRSYKIQLFNETSLGLTADDILIQVISSCVQAEARLIHPV